MEYIKDVVFLETNKRLNSAMNLSEYFCVIGCHLIMAYYVGNSVRGFFLKDNITPIKLSPSPSTTSSLGGALRISLRLCLTLILPFLSSMSCIFGAIWDGTWLRTHSIKMQRLGLLMEDGREKVGGPWYTTSLWNIQDIVENGLLMRINGRGSRIPTRSRYATIKAVLAIFIQGGISDALRDSSYVMSVMQLMFLMLIPKN